MTDAAPSDETLADGVPAATARRELARGTTVGRYVVLARVGSGGMGVVYAAYDPDLDRRVALKLLHPERSSSVDALARIVREAQAMARLSHPNVVAVHDVGEHEGGVFVAMELVPGQTLSAWMAATSRSVGEILEVTLAAGAGLAAAHDKGLVHRDFKPDNVLIGDDGRVRVMDFGLARANLADLSVSDGALATGSEIAGEPDLRPSTDVLRVGLTRAGAIMGTPGYMAPEQIRGTAIGAAADQFAFCVTLYEALVGERPFVADTPAALAFAVTHGRVRAAPRGSRVPAWLRAVLLRGLAPAPEDRFPSMHALLRALAHDPTPRRRRTVVLAASGILALGGLAGLRWDASRRAAACADEAGAIDEVWNPEAATAMHAGMLATGIAHAQATYEHARPWLADYAQSWQQMYEDTCVAATVERTLDPLQWSAAQACLLEQRMALTEAVEVLSHADAATLAGAVMVAVQLAPLQRCVDLEAEGAPLADGERSMPAQAARQSLARAAVRRWAGDYAGARQLAELAHAAAQAEDAPRLQVRTRLELGRVAMDLADLAGAEEHLQAALVLAGARRIDDLAAVAATDLVTLTGIHLARVPEGRAWARQAEMWLDRVGAEAEDPRRALLLQARGNLANTSGDWAEARVDLQRAAELAEQRFGSEHPDTGIALHNLGLVEHRLGDLPAAQRDLERALEIMERAFGPEHPEVANVLAAWGELATRADRKPEAVVALRRALAIREGALGTEHPTVAHALFTLADALHPRAESIDLLRRALAINEQALGPEHPVVGTCLNDLGINLAEAGRLDEAQPLYERAIAIASAHNRDAPELAFMQRNLGALHRDRGDWPAAARAFAAAAAQAERILGAGHEQTEAAWLWGGYARLRMHEPEAALALLERALARRRERAAPESAIAFVAMLRSRAQWELGQEDRARRRDEAAEHFAAVDGATLGRTGRAVLAEMQTWFDEHPGTTAAEAQLSP